MVQAHWLDAVVKLIIHSCNVNKMDQHRSRGPNSKTTGSIKTTHICMYHAIGALFVDCVPRNRLKMGWM